MPYICATRIYSLLAITSLAACVSVPTGQIIQEEGKQPTRQEAEAVVLKHLKRALRDPDSMKDFAIVSDPELLTGTTAGRNYERAWHLCVEYNAKNAYGGYTGLKTESYSLRFSGSDLSIISTINWIARDKNC